MCSYKPKGDNISVKTRRQDLSSVSDSCGEADTSSLTECEKGDRERMIELEEKFNKGWESWISQMGGEMDICTYNFDAEELAVRLGMRVDKASALHAKILLQKIYHFWHCRQHTDMVLIAGEDREEVHLHMFLAHSEFYDKVVMVPCWEKLWKAGKLVIDLTGMVSPKALKLIIGFVYTGAAKLTLDNVTDIAMAAKNMGLRKLQKQCMEFLDYVFADFHLFVILRNVPMDHKYFDVAWTKILKRFKFIYHDPNFLEMDSGQLELLVASDKLNIDSEYQAFEAVLSWINHDRTNREKFFFKLMGQVRFAYMELDELIGAMKEEELFRTNKDAQKMLEDADMYATMESMGDQWCNYPPWPPRNDTIARKVYVRQEKLKNLRPKSKNDICNANLPCPLQTNYGAKFDKTCPSDGNDDRTCRSYCGSRGYGKILPLSCTPGLDDDTGTMAKSCAGKRLQEDELEIFGLSEPCYEDVCPKPPRKATQNECPKPQKKPLNLTPAGPEACTNRAKMLDELRINRVAKQAADLCGRKEQEQPDAKSICPALSMATLGSKEINVVKGVSEISLPSVMMKRQNRAP